MDQQILIDRAVTQARGHTGMWTFTGLFNDEGLELLADQFPETTIVHLMDTQITDAGIASLNRLTSLKILSTYLTDVSAKFVEQLDLPNLNRLHISLDQFSPAAARQITRLPSLEELQIDAGIVFDQVPNQPFSDDVLAILGDCPQLESLETYGLHLDGSCFEALAKLPLTKLELRATYAPAEAIAKFAACTTVKKLGFEYSSLDDQALATLLDAMDLEELAIENTKVSAAYLDRIMAMPNLFSLQVDGHAIGPEGFLKLAQMQQLDYLTCRGLEDKDDLEKQFHEIRSKLINLEL